MNYIYTVTTIRIRDAHKHNRTVGWFLDKERAFKCLDKNLGDLIESGYYQYGVVEKIQEGLYPDSIGEDGNDCRWFWKACRKGGKEYWERIEGEPDETKPADGGWTSYCQIG